MRALALGTRSLLRRPLVAFTSAVCLALGLAAAAVAWTLLDAGVRRPFGLDDTGRLLVIWETDPARNHPLIEVSLLNFLDWQREARTLTSMAAFGSQHWPGLARIDGKPIPLALRGVSSTFFPTLGVGPALGRNFDRSDARPNAAPPIMLSHRLWQSRFGGSPAVIGRELFLDGANHVVIGVMPRGFAYPDDPDGWVSVERVLGEAFQTMPVSQQRGIGVLQVLARRQIDASVDDVRRELTSIIQKLQRQHSSSVTAVTTTAAVTPFADVVLGRLGARVWIALAMSIAVFLLACANVGAVRSAHLRERTLEIGARMFLGATRARIIKQLTIESLPLVGCGAALGVALAFALLRLLATATAIGQSGVDFTGHTTSTLTLLLLLGVLGCALVGVWPALLAWRRGVTLAQQPHFRTGARISRIGAPLLLGQAATAIVVVALATVALATFARLSRVDLGFSMANVALVDVAVPGWKYGTPADERQLVERLESELRGLALVDNVAAVSVRPFRFGEIVDGQPVRRTGDALVQPEEAVAASRVVVTPDYFAALGQPIVAGRGFTGADRPEGEGVAIISRTLARAVFGARDPLGQSIETFSLSEKWRPRRIVGIVGDARYRGLERPSMEVYVPHTQVAAPLGSLVISSRAPIGVDDLHAAFARVDPDIAVERLQTTAELRDAVLSPALLLATIVSLLGGTGLLLLSIGIFGAAAAALRSAWAEIAVRQAIGAQPLQAARAPLRPLSRALLAGVVTGVALTPIVLSGAGALGLQGDGDLLPIAVAVFCVPAAAGAAVVPSLWRATRQTPSALLRIQN